LEDGLAAGSFEHASSIPWQVISDLHCLPIVIQHMSAYSPPAHPSWAKEDQTVPFLGWDGNPSDCMLSVSGCLAKISVSQCLGGHSGQEKQTAVCRYFNHGVLGLDAYGAETELTLLGTRFMAAGTLRLGAQ
jgi:hypothetical protein